VVKLAITIQFVSVILIECKIKIKLINFKFVVVINKSLFFMLPCFINYYLSCNSYEVIPMQYHVLFFIIESILTLTKIKGNIAFKLSCSLESHDLQNFSRFMYEFMHKFRHSLWIN